jgi:two-component system, cell cycle sensor histidine kinase and response regulator CckA
MQLFKANSDQIDLVFLDVVMPGVNGPEAYLQMSAIRPGLGVILTTGYTSEVASLVSLSEGGVPILQKPYGPKNLSQMIRKVLDHKHSVEPSNH